ncbi:NUDIX domain-containing protein [Streptomyces sp. ST1015]|uniref:NUDIX domain-containing protein n=1 Tax=Streptomyces sp. ST1015 TaxID=1848900 RepID=UPI000DD8517D|nr:MULTISPECIES: NUDIX domain-containing protein [unclassified Streptomyces]QZZ28068.1 NUDIX domain-containing protein [Streptomyces sp. ST1015]
MTLLAAAVIVHDKSTGRIVLLQRGQHAKFGRGLWDLPAGKGEPGEPITTTAVRELYEETGLTVHPDALHVAQVIHGAWGVGAPDGYLSVVFAVHEWSGELQNREPDKHARVCWVDTDAVPGEFVEASWEALRGYFAGSSQVSLTGWE